MRRSRIKEDQGSKIKDQRFTDHESKITDQANQIKKNTDQRSTSNQVFEDQRSKKDQRFQKSVIDQSSAKKLKR